jgi:hypothetical protein
VIDATEACIRALSTHFRGAYPVAFMDDGDGGFLKTPTELGATIVEGWSNQQDTLIYPSIEVDAPVAGERSGRTATVLSQSSAPGANWFYTVHLGTIELPLQVRVSADSKVERAAIDLALDVMMAGDFVNGTPIVVSEPVDEYYDEVFQLRQAGTTKYFDSVTTAGRNEFTSVREIEATGSVVVRYLAAGFADLSLQMKVVEMGGDFDLVVGEDVLIFDQSTP